MELKLNNGVYTDNGRGGPVSVDGVEEKLQRATMRLAARRGGFAPMADFGSRLYLLPREKKQTRKSAAELYVAEALAEETWLKIIQVSVDELGDTLSVRVEIAYDEGTATLTADVKE